MDDSFIPPEMPEHTWKPGDPPLLPPVPESCYPPDAVPLEPLPMFSNNN